MSAQADLFLAEVAALEAAVAQKAQAAEALKNAREKEEVAFIMYKHAAIMHMEEILGLYMPGTGECAPAQAQ